MKNNLFPKKIDGFMYLFTYILIPIMSVIICMISVSDTLSLAYLYFTTICNSIGCLHDCVSRWDDNIATKKNRKILKIGICMVIITMYAIIELILILNNKKPLQLNIIFLLYGVHIFVSLPDIYATFANET